MVERRRARTAAPRTLSWPIDKIRIGERTRKDMGDIAGLAANIAEIGLLHPIVVKPDGTLIAGQWRLCALQQLGWKTVPIRVLDIEVLMPVRERNKVTSLNASS